MVDYKLDQVDCFTKFWLKEDKYGRYSGIPEHDQWCVFPKPDFFCPDHWGWEDMDNYPFFETFKTWSQNKRPSKSGHRLPEHLKFINTRGYKGAGYGEGLF